MLSGACKLWCKLHHYFFSQLKIKADQITNKYPTYWIQVNSIATRRIKHRKRRSANNKIIRLSFFVRHCLHSSDTWVSWIYRYIVIYSWCLFCRPRKYKSIASNLRFQQQIILYLTSHRVNTTKLPKNEHRANETTTKWVFTQLLRPNQCRYQDNLRMIFPVRKPQIKICERLYSFVFCRNCNFYQHSMNI